MQRNSIELLYLVWHPEYARITENELARFDELVGAIGAESRAAMLYYPWLGLVRDKSTIIQNSGGPRGGLDHFRKTLSRLEPIEQRAQELLGERFIFGYPHDLLQPSREGFGNALLTRWCDALNGEPRRFEQCPEQREDRLLRQMIVFGNDSGCVLAIRFDYQLSKVAVDVHDGSWFCPFPEACLPTVSIA